MLGAVGNSHLPTWDRIMRGPPARQLFLVKGGEGGHGALETSGESKAGDRRKVAGRGGGEMAVTEATGGGGGGPVAKEVEATWPLPVAGRELGG